MKREIRKISKKIDELQKQLNQQNEYIMDQSLIIQKLIEKLIVIPSAPYTPSIDPHFGKDIPYVPYKGTDCESKTTTPMTYTSYDGSGSPPSNVEPVVDQTQSITK